MSELNMLKIAPNLEDEDFKCISWWLRSVELKLTKDMSQPEKDRVWRIPQKTRAEIALTSRRKVIAAFHFYSQIFVINKSERVFERLQPLLREP